MIRMDIIKYNGIVESWFDWSFFMKKFGQTLTAIAFINRPRRISLEYNIVLIKN